MSFKLSAVALIAVAFMGAPASAAVFTDRASFLAATTITQTATFEGRVPDGFGATYYGDLAGYAGVFFAAHDIYIDAHDYFPPGFLAADAAYGSDYLEWASELTLTFLDLATFDDASVVAVGFDFMEERGYPATFTIKAGGVTTMISPGLTDAASFFGFTSATPFDSLTISMTGRSPDIYALRPTLDNVSYRLAAAPSPGVPEPGAWALMILGFGSAGAMLRRRRMAVSAG
jgi:hypothetical protein